MYGGRPITIPCRSAGSHTRNGRDIKIIMMRLSPLTDLLRIPSQPVPAFLQDAQQNKTALIFNSGAWIHNVTDYQRGLDAFLTCVDSRTRTTNTTTGIPASNIYAFYRETLPSHPECAPGQEYIQHDPKMPLVHEARETASSLLPPYATYQDYLTHQKMANQSHWPSFWQTTLDETIAYNPHARHVLEHVRPQRCD